MKIYEKLYYLSNKFIKWEIFENIFKNFNQLSTKTSSTFYFYAFYLHCYDERYDNLDTE